MNLSEYHHRLLTDFVVVVFSECCVSILACVFQEADLIVVPTAVRLEALIVKGIEQLIRAELLIFEEAYCTDVVVKLSKSLFLF